MSYLQCSRQTRWKSVNEQKNFFLFVSLTICSSGHPCLMQCLETLSLKALTNRRSRRCSHNKFRWWNHSCRCCSGGRFFCWNNIGCHCFLGWLFRWRNSGCHCFGRCCHWTPFANHITIFVRQWHYCEGLPFILWFFVEILTIFSFSSKWFTAESAEESDSESLSWVEFLFTLLIIDRLVSQYSFVPRIENILSNKYGSESYPTTQPNIYVVMNDLYFDQLSHRYQVSGYLSWRKSNHPVQQ